jgi:acyl-CoA thioesterase
MMSVRDMTPADHRAQEIARDMLAKDQASRALGIEIIEAICGRAQIGMTIRPGMVNGFGICHGGVLFTFADTAFAFACNSHGEPAVAAGASIEYLEPAAVGERVTAIAREISQAGRTGIYDVAITTAAGRAVAHFRGRSARRRAAAEQPNVKDL